MAEFGEDVVMRVSLYYKSIDFTKYGEEPSMDVDTTVATTLIDVNRLNRILIPARENTIETEEAYLQLGQSDEYTFFDIGTI